MRHVVPDEILSAVPLRPEMTRQQKLERWANLICEQKKTRLVHDLECWNDHQLTYPMRANPIYFDGTPFWIASNDPVFKEMGIEDSVEGVMKFFEISQKELHEFTCDCGGSISSMTVARRIRHIADPSWQGFVRNLFR